MDETTKRAKHDQQFKLDAVRLASEGGKSIAAAAPMHFRAIQLVLQPNANPIMSIHRAAGCGRPYVQLFIRTEK